MTLPLILSWKNCIISSAALGVSAFRASNQLLTSASALVRDCTTASSGEGASLLNSSRASGFPLAPPLTASNISTASSAISIEASSNLALSTPLSTSGTSMESLSSSDSFKKPSSSTPSIASGFVTLPLDPLKTYPIALPKAPAISPARPPIRAALALALSSLSSSCCAK